MTNPWPPGMDALVQIWMESLRGCLPGGIFAAAATNEPLKAMQTAMLQAWGQWWEQFSRSPEVLQAMKQSLDSSIASQRQANDWLSQWQHATGSASRDDADALIAAVGRLERRLTETLERMNDRLAGMDERLGRLEEVRRRKKKKHKPDRA